MGTFLRPADLCESGERHQRTSSQRKEYLAFSRKRGGPIEENLIISPCHHESEESHPEGQDVGCTFGVRRQGVEGREQITVFEVQSLQPGALIRTLQIGRSLQTELPVVLGV